MKKLYFIYGPAGSGKLTVAKKLAEKLSAKLFDNHLTIDVALNLFEYGTSEYISFIANLRLFCFKEAFSSNVENLIYTCCYDEQEDVEYVREAIEICRNLDVEIVFINLICDQTEREKRVLTESRLNTTKVKSVEDLQKYESDWDPYNQISFVDNIVINNTEKSVDEVVFEILN